MDGGKSYEFNEIAKRLNIAQKDAIAAFESGIRKMQIIAIKNKDLYPDIYEWFCMALQREQQRARRNAKKSD